MTGATALAAGGQFTCALVAGGGAKCWGDNFFGQLGNGTSFNSTTAVSVTGVTGATALAAASRHACVVVAGGAVKCWGQNIEGELGNGTTISSTIPVNVTGMTGATTLAAGTNHSCAIVSGGALKCWGRNYEGQLGNSTDVSSSTPVAVTDVTSVTAVAAGWFHTCAVVAGGAVKCWGSKRGGQLGNGTTSSYETPQHVIGSPFSSSLALVAFADDGLLVNGSAATFSIGVSAGSATATGLHLTATPSSTLSRPVWSCEASGGASCPALTLSSPVDHRGEAMLDVNFNLPVYGALRFSLNAIVDASTGGFAIVATRLDAANLPGGSSSAVTSIPLYGDGLFLSGFEGSGQ